MRKKAIISGFLCLLCGIMLVSCKPAMQKGDVSSDAFTASMVANVRPIDRLKALAKIDGNSKVKISWSAVSRARSYVISRSENNGDKWKVLKTLSPKNTSFTDETAKMGMEYHYTVQAYCEYSKTDYFAYSKKQMPESLETECEIYTGVGDAFWDKEAAQKKQKIGSISLTYSFGSNGKEAVEPEGVEIYRGTAKNKLQLLERGLVKDISTQDFDFGRSYMDKTVEQGKSYYYQVRAYAVLDGKRVYGKKSSVLKMQAAEPEGIYSVRLVKEPGSYSSDIAVAITSVQKKNGTLTLTSNELSQRVTMMYRMTPQYYQQSGDGTTTSYTAASPAPKAAKPPYQIIKLKADRYSTDGRYYKQITEDIVLKPQQTVYLEFSPIDQTQKMFSSYNLESEEINFQARYNEGDHLLNMNLKKQKAVLKDIPANGSYQMWIEKTGKKKNGQTNSIKVGLLSSLGDNKKLTFKESDLQSIHYTYQRKSDDKLLNMTLKLKRYSEDGVKWKKPHGNLGLQPSGVLYFELVPVTSSETIPFEMKGQRHGEIVLNGIYGKNGEWTAQLDLLNKKIEAVDVNN